MLRKLCSLGYAVRAIRRQSSDISQFKDLEVEWFVGDVYDQEVLQKAMQGVHQIYHLAAAYRVTNLPDSELYDVHVKSTQILAKLALQQDGFEKFVHVSTVGVLGHIENPPADEDTAYNPGDVYQETKTEAEIWLQEFGQKEGLAYTVVRPAAIYGPGDRRLLKLFKLAKLPLIPLIGNTHGLYHLIHVEDLVEFIWFTSTTNETDSNIYICGSPKANSIKGMVTTISRHLGKEPRFVRIPAKPLFWLSSLVEAISKKLNVEPVLYPRRVAFFTKDRSFDTSKMQSLQGFSYKYSDQQGIEQLADWYLNEGWL